MLSGPVSSWQKKRRHLTFFQAHLCPLSWQPASHTEGFHSSSPASTRSPAPPRSPSISASTNVATICCHLDGLWQVGQGEAALLLLEVPHHHHQDAHLHQMIWLWVIKTSLTFSLSEKYLWLIITTANKSPLRMLSAFHGKLAFVVSLKMLIFQICLRAYIVIFWTGSTFIALEYWWSQYWSPISRVR